MLSGTISNENIIKRYDNRNKIRKDTKSGIEFENNEKLWYETKGKYTKARKDNMRIKIICKHGKS